MGEALAAYRESAFGYCLQALSADAAAELLRAFRRKLGPELRILYDGRQRFDLEGALMIGGTLVTS